MSNRTFFALALSFSSLTALAAPAVDGLWQATYQETGTPSAQIQITTLPSGEVQGIIHDAKPKPGDTKQSAYCTACTGANKDKPIKGLKILWGMQPDGSNNWEGGKILDADSGKVYSVKMSLINGGNTIKLRAYVLNPLLGETINWKRIK